MATPKQLSARDARRLSAAYEYVHSALWEVRQRRSHVDSAMARLRETEAELLKRRADVGVLCAELGIEPDNQALERLDDDNLG